MLARGVLALAVVALAIPFASSTPCAAGEPLSSVASSGSQAMRAENPCGGHRCDTEACPCGCECGNATDPGVCYVPPLVERAELDAGRAAV